MMKISRFKAFGYHFSASILIALVSSILVFVVWYKWPLAIAAGVTHIFVILIFIDVVIGPVITFIIFDHKKKELKRDLFIIVILQIGALLYGLHTVFTARPVYLVFNTDRFDLVFANDLTAEKMSKVTNPQFQTIPLFSTSIVAAQKPLNPKARNEILFSAILGGDDLPQMPQYYVPFSSAKLDVVKHTRPLKELLPFNKSEDAQLSKLEEKYRLAKIDAGFLPLKGKVQDLSIIMDKESGAVLEIVDLKPWN